MYKKYINPETEQITKMSSEGKRNKKINFEREIESQPKEIKPLIRETKPLSKETKPLNLQISQKKIQEAIIWSEILGKPMCKRRKRR